MPGSATDSAGPHQAPNPAATLNRGAKSSVAQATQYGDGTDSRQDGVCRPGRLTPIDDYAGGPGRGAASLLWRNRDDDFPDWAGRDLTSRDPTARLVLLASDGRHLGHGGG
jgi:hypothetical protein